MEFLEVVENIQNEAASVQRLFNGEGRSMRRNRRQAQDPRYMRKLGEAAAFLADIYQGSRPVHQLREALTTSDFPNLFGDIIDRQLLANYEAAPKSWPAWARKRTVPDFRTVKRFYVNNGDLDLTAVEQDAEYPEDSNVADGVYSYSVTKYGRRMPFSWETIINDDLDALRDIPQRFGIAAANTEEKLATKLAFDANGPNASFFTAGNKNIINTTNGASATNPALSASALLDGYKVMAAQTAPDGVPILNRPAVLVVPPQLEVVAQSILHALQIWFNDNGGTSNERLIVKNWLSGGLKYVVDHYIPIVATTNGTTSFILTCPPEQGRGAFEMGFLRGHEQPEVFMKMPDSQRVGGGMAMDPMIGSFANDSIEYKVRHVLGSVQLDGRYAVSSNGSGA